MRHIPRFSCPDDHLAKGVTIRLSEQAAHHARIVLRARDGGEIKLFNVKDGEWQGVMHFPDRRQVDVLLHDSIGQAEILPEVTLILAPLKNKDSFDNAIRHAVELGVTTIQLVQTARTQQSKLNAERLQQQIIDAVQQCGRLTVPDLKMPVPLAEILKQASVERVIWACVEGENGQTPELHQLIGKTKSASAILIGPEGGFSDEEKILIHKQGDHVIPVSLGSLILRSDTAVAAALGQIMVSRQ